MGPDPAGIGYLQLLFQRAIQLAVAVAFIVLVIMLTVGGIKYLTSGGDSKGLQSASNTFTWALLGILFMVLAWLILLLIQNFTGVNVTKFCLGFPGVSTACP